jgi:hypothetical protein
MHKRHSSALLAAVVFGAVHLAVVDAQNITVPNQPDSVKFAVIGDSSTASPRSSTRRVPGFLTSSC